MHERIDQTGKRSARAQPPGMVTSVTTRLIHVSLAVPTNTPAPLVTAASLAAVEGGLMVALAVIELASLAGGRFTMGVSTAAFFGGYGAALVWCAWAIVRGHGWARGPILLAQLIQLGLAWSFRGGQTTVVAVVIAVVAVVVIAGLVHPASVDALDRERTGP